ncbi:putative neutral sphingomyelinase [Glandiceps talaboti]
MDSGKSTELRVLNLNCWGVPYFNVSKLRHERMSDIGQELSKGLVDIICLQELWDFADFEKIRDAIKEKYPHFHYFHSGVIGSGLSVFSKSPIIDAFFHHYSVNGYPHRYRHGDWYGGKMVGLCQVLHQGLTINVYVTHFHAEYNYAVSPYRFHRLIQAFELCQFLEHTRHTSDISIIAGDFNTEPNEIGYELFCKLTGAKDCWISQTCKQDSDDPGYTSCLPHNSFTSRTARQKRIDYIFYQANKQCNVECSECHVTMGIVPGKSHSFSDHEAVSAIFKITTDQEKSKPEYKDQSCEDNARILREMRQDLTMALEDLKSRQLWTRIGLLLSLMLSLIWFIPLFDNIKVIVLLVVTLIIAYLFGKATIGLRMERKSYRECLNNMTLKINSLERKRKQ